MTGPLTDEVLRRSLANVLEEAAFVFTEPTDGPSPAAQEALIARLAFRGDHVGELWLVVPEELGWTLAANMLGIEDRSEARAASVDATGELLNILGGVLVEACWGQGVRCDFGTPTVARGDWPESELLALRRVTLIAEDEQRVDLAVHCKEEA